MARAAPTTEHRSEPGYTELCTEPGHTADPGYSSVDCTSPRYSTEPGYSSVAPAVYTEAALGPKQGGARWCCRWGLVAAAVALLLLAAGAIVLRGSGLDSGVGSSGLGSSGLGSSLGSGLDSSGLGSTGLGASVLRGAGVEGWLTNSAAAPEGVAQSPGSAVGSSVSQPQAPAVRSQEAARGGEARGQDAHEYVFMGGLQRSGTTWLEGLVASPMVS